MIDSDSLVDNIPIKRKRGIHHPEKYKRNSIRGAKVKGDEHLNYVGNWMIARRNPAPLTLSW